MAFLETLIALALGPAASRAAPYMAQARWRAGPLGRPLPALRPDRIPSPNPVVNVGSAAGRRQARAQAITRAPRRSPRG